MKNIILLCHSIILFSCIPLHTIQHHDSVVYVQKDPSEAQLLEQFIAILERIIHVLQGQINNRQFFLNSFQRQPLVDDRNLWLKIKILWKTPLLENQVVRIIFSQPDYYREQQDEQNKLRVS
jgi:hypothetical protein